MLQWNWVDHHRQLSDLCQAWQTLPWLAIDTEFSRERTFYAELGLLQVNDGQEITLLDTQAISDLAPFLDLLTASDGPEIILHSGREDLEILLQRTQLEAGRVFDTQVAAALCGIDPQAGYARLLEMLFVIPVDKGETRSNWLQRPLSDAQLHYAAVDVAHLPALYDYLKRRLDTLGRTNWLYQDCTRLFSRDALYPPLEDGYKRFGQEQRMSRAQLAVLRAVSVWREQQAMQKNRPRGHILPNEDVMRLAQKLPRDSATLLKQFRSPSVKRHANAILGCIDQALSLPEAEQPNIEQPLDEQESRRRLKSLRRAVREQADQLGLAAPLLANRHLLALCVRQQMLGEPVTLADDWRKPFLQAALQQAA
jgi:ribonuclease D